MNTSKKQTTSSPTHVSAFGGDQFFVSEELADRVDMTQFDKLDTEPEVDSQASPGSTRAPVMATPFICGVTLSDGEELLGDVLSFQKTPTSRSVTLRASSRIVDDICTAFDIRAIRVFSRLQTEVFNVEFDVMDPLDQPDISYMFTPDNELTLSFSIEPDSYNKEDSTDGT